MRKTVTLNDKKYKIEYNPEALIKRNRFKAYRIGEGLYAGRDFKINNPIRIKELKEVIGIA